MQTVTAIIPAYNEADRIIYTINHVEPFVDEIIVIDDASTDGTGNIARKEGAKVLTQTKNRGYISAIKYGFKEACGEIAVIIDADGEFPAQEIPNLIKPIINGHADMVQGHRNYIPRLSEKILTWLAQTKTNVGDSGTGFRAIKTKLAQSLDIKGVCICGVFSLEVVAKGGRITEIPITLKEINKSRKIAWFHFQQFFYLLPWLLKNFDKQT